MGELLTLDEAIARREALRWSQETLVLTNGHFDLLHVGHVDYLEKASQLADVFYVGINDDASTQRLKGKGRPIIPAAERARLLAALACIQGVIVFEGDTADNLIDKLRPDVYAKGGDYTLETLPERATVERYGGRIELIEYLPGHSTSAIIAKIKALP